MKSNIESDLVIMALYSHGIRLRGLAISPLPLARKLRKIAIVSARLEGDEMACGSGKKRKGKKK